jgi:hypothetical protein
LLNLGSPKSAGDNVVSPMRRLGLIDEDGALTARGNKWRLDTSYGEACREIVTDVYPDELSHLTDEDGKPDAQKVRTWFDHKGFGDSNARQMAATYVMIAGQEVPSAVGSEPRQSPAKKTTGTGKKSASARNSRKDPPATEPQVAPSAHRQAAPADVAMPQRSTGPNVHLDIQIHIPADASVEQIDQIFASMAKHLYGQ